MHVQQFFVEGLGHQSYLVTDEASGTAAVVDPRRDVAIYLEAAERAGARITHVFETHVHNDYITGARELAEPTGAIIVSAVAAGLEYEHLGVREGDRVRVGGLTFAVLDTPGHTPTHVSYAVYEPGREAPQALFSGGSMLVANAGRTDLVSPGMTLTLTRAQYRSLRRLLEALPDDVPVYPTHGAGSFCGATNAAPPARHPTIGQERLVSPAAQAHDEADFVKQQFAGYGVYPRYYAYMGEINQRGPHLLGGLPQLAPLSPQAVHDHMTGGIPLIDGRQRDIFAREHVPGSFNIELDAQFGIYVGWILPFDKPLLLLVDDESGRREAVAQLIRIGFEQLQGYLEGGLSAWRAAGFPTASFDAHVQDRKTAHSLGAAREFCDPGRARREGVAEWPHSRHTAHPHRRPNGPPQRAPAGPPGGDRLPHRAPRRDGRQHRRRAGPADDRGAAWRCPRLGRQGLGRGDGHLASGDRARGRTRASITAHLPPESV